MHIHTPLTPLTSFMSPPPLPILPARSALEIDKITAWVLSSQFGAICDQIKYYVEEDCLVIKGTMEVGSYVLLLCVVLMFASFSITMRCGQGYFGLHQKGDPVLLRPLV